MDRVLVSPCAYRSGLADEDGSGSTLSLSEVWDFPSFSLEVELLEVLLACRRWVR